MNMAHHKLLLNNWTYQIFLMSVWIAIFLTARFDSLTTFYIITSFFILLLIMYMFVLKFSFTFPSWSLWGTLILVSVFQNLLIGLVVSDQVSSDKGKVLIGLQFLYIIIVLFFNATVFFLKKNKQIYFTKADVVACLFIGFVIVEFIMSDFSVSSRLASLRNMAGGALIYLMVRSSHFNLVPIDNESKLLKQFTAFLLKITIIVVFLGISEYILDSFWNTYNFYINTLNMEKVFLAKQGVETIPSGVFQGNFLGYRINRLISVYYEAINPSYFLAATTVVAYIMRKRIVAIFSAIALILTFSKGGWLILLVTGYVIFLETFGMPKLLKIIGYAFMFIVGIALMYVLIFKLTADSATSHYLGLYYGFQHALQNPLGVGLGGGGTHGDLAGISFYKTGGESGVGFILYTTGFLGFSFWLMWMLSLLQCLYQAAKIEVDKRWRTYMIGIFGLTLALTLATFMQENALSTTANYLYFILAGIAVRKAVNQGLLKGFIVRI